MLPERNDPSRFFFFFKKHKAKKKKIHRVCLPEKRLISSRLAQEKPFGMRF